MGLVQAKPEDDEEKRHFSFDQIRIIWDDNIEQMSELYGRLSIDHEQSYFGERLVIGFDGVSC